MDSYAHIEEKLEQFIRKYYINELIRGGILFAALGLFYFLLTLLIEYFFWLSPPGRTALFWLFILVEVGLLIRFVVIPLLRLFRLSKGIQYEDAAQIIGNHFPEVKDKLLNVLQLKRSSQSSELVQAGILQKSAALEPIPFRMAVNIRDNVTYVKYLAIPVLLFIAVNFLGSDNPWSSSYERVVNYGARYEPPAPFQFFVLNDTLETIENRDFKVQLSVEGKIVPEDIRIHIGETSYLLQKEGPGIFTFVFEQPSEDVSFYFEANEVVSKSYTLGVVEVPVIVDFTMELAFPSHTKKAPQQIRNTGNAIIPEGTEVRWRLGTKETSEVQLALRDTSLNFKSTGDRGSRTFTLSRKLTNTLHYEISTSNDVLRDFEKLGYTLEVIKDEYPEMQLEFRKDSSGVEQHYFYGKISDDYGLTRLQLVYYEQGNENRSVRSIPIEKGNVDTFLQAFPDTLALQPGKTYEYHFEVFDNDVVNNYKRTKSAVFTYANLSASEKERVQLKAQENAIQNLSKSLNAMESREKELEQLSRLQKEKRRLNFNDKQKLDDFLKRQEKQDALMKKFSQELKENLDEFQKEDLMDDEEKQRLKERLERLEEQAKKDEALLKELEKMKEKISKEQLAEKLDKLAKKNKNNKRNLEQMLELTKRYYVQKKAEKIARDLQELAERQEALSKKGKENTPEAQEKLNDEYQKVEEDIKALSKENQALKKPMDIPEDPKKQEAITDSQKEATSALKEEEQQEKSGDKAAAKQQAQAAQKKAAEKMKQMAQKMQSQMASAGGQSMQEDAEMLRRILENLLTFSFEEEALMDRFRALDDKNPDYANQLRRQNVLKQNFTHIDDSLYALSLRRAELTEFINETLVDIDYNLNQSLERLAENQVLQGVSSQQYVITGANKLADFLSNTLDAMQNQMMSGQGQGEGDGQGMQLPDIIQSQEELNKKMQQGNKPGQQSGEGEGSEQQEGNPKDGEQEGQEEGERGSKKGGEGEDEGEGPGGNTSGSQPSESREGDPRDAEYEQGLLFEIYKEQQRLRQQLEDAIEKNGLGEAAKALAKDMEGVEKQLLDKGFSQETMERMTALKHELLKLQEATLEQGEEEKRESRTNTEQFSNPTSKAQEKMKSYFNTTEILNRKTLPLTERYKKRVQKYFRRDD